MNASIETRLPQTLAVAAVIIVGAIVILLATSGPPSTAASGNVTSSGGGTTVDIKNFKYDPPDLKVSAGSKVTFANDDTANHTATAPDGGFDTGDLSQGDKATVTLSKPGTYDYVCSFHSFMRGTITVK